jgi:hypothetical protein
VHVDPPGPADGAESAAALGEARGATGPATRCRALRGLAPLGGSDTGGLPALAGAAMAGKILFDYLNMPDDVYGRSAWRRHQARWLVDRGGFDLIDQLNACVNDGDMSIEDANAILDQLFQNSITSAQAYVEYAEFTGNTNNHFYYKLKCALQPEECPPIPPPPLRPQYSDYDSPSRYSGYRESSPLRPPPLRPQTSVQDNRGRM